MYEVRDTTIDDLSDIIEIITTERKELSKRQPVFWRPHKDAKMATQAHFGHLLSLSTTHSLVAIREHTIVGFIIATIVGAPPVYDPGGSTLMIDDFAVSQSEDKEAVYQALFDVIRSAASKAGAAQIVCVAANHDELKAKVLASEGMQAISSWWTIPL